MKWSSQHPVVTDPAAMRERIDRLQLELERLRRAIDEHLARLDAKRDSKPEDSTGR
jgi:hypothetical protein